MLLVMGTAVTPFQTNGVITSPYTIDIPVVDVLSFCRPSFANASRIAITDLSSNKSCSYGEIETKYERLSKYLYKHGLRKGGKLGVCLPNCIEYEIVILATLRLGATLVLVNHLSTKDELRRCFEMTGCTIVVASNKLVPKVREICTETHGIQAIFAKNNFQGTISLSTCIDNPERVIDSTKIPSLKDLSINPRRDIAVILFSSGTTGLPKAVMLSHFNIISAQVALRHQAYDNIEDPVNSIVYQPMSHSYGFCRTLFCIISGMSLLTMPRFNLESFLKTIENYKIRAIQIVPPIAVMLCKSELTKRYDLSSIEIIMTSAAPMGSELEDQLKLLFRKEMKIIQAYGMTESSGIVACTPGNDVFFNLPPPGTVGILSPNSKAMIVDPKTRQPLGSNEKGEIWMTGPQVMAGYLNNSIATKETVDEDGWLHTGDLGYFDNDGYFFVIDRLKELIKYKGFQVAPAELEALLISHPSVADVAVIGIPDHECGELPQAWIVKKDNNSICLENDIVEWLHDKVAPFKRLRGGVKFVQSIPKSTSGKILRNELKRILNLSKL